MNNESCNQALAAYAGRMISVCGHLSDYGDRIQEPQQVSDEQQTQQADDPSGDGWRDVEVGEILQSGDMLSDGTRFVHTDAAGSRCTWQGVYRRRIEPPQLEPQPNQDDPSGPGWRDVGPDEPIEQGDKYTPDGHNWLDSDAIGRRPSEFPNRLEFPNLRYRRRIEQPRQQSESETQAINPDDPSGPGWRWVERNEVLRDDDMQQGSAGIWRANRYAGKPAIDNRTYRRRIEQLQQPSDSETETVEDLRRRLAECEVLLAEAERGGQQVNAELQQLREQLATSQHLAEMSRRQVQDEAGKVERLKTQLWDAVEARQKAERELATETKCYRDSFKANHKAGQQQLVDRLQTWLRPVLEVVSDHPDHTSILAASVLEFLPQIASRLIEE